MGIRLKLSDFNIRIGGDDDTTPPRGLYNSSTGNYLALSEQMTEIYNKLLRAETLTPPEAGLFYTAGFAVESDLNELAAIRYGFELSRRHRTSPQLTIAPTLACNFGCAYCFEKHVRGQMSPAVQDGLINFVEKVMIEPADTLSVSWFGGEPLMGLPTIRRLAKIFLDMVERGKISAYSSKIITNGLLLKREVAQELLNLSVRSVQVTLDGPRNIHDRRRVMKGNGGGTFEGIVRNIADLPEELQVVVRMNVDRQNKDYISDLFAELNEFGLLSRVVVSIAKVEDFSGQRELSPSLLSSTEFAALEVEMIKKAQTERWPLYVSKPSSRITGVCQVDSVNSFVVAPTGELFKCYAELGNNGHIVAHLLKPETWKQLEPTRLTQRDPFDDAECRSCVVLPLCMGCCPLLRQNNRDLGKKVCPPFKHNFAEILRLQFGDETQIVNFIHPFEVTEDVREIL